MSEQVLLLTPDAPDDAARWDAINKRVLDIIYSPVAPSPVESDLVWLARRFVQAHQTPSPEGHVQGTSDA